MANGAWPSDLRETHVVGTIYKLEPSGTKFRHPVTVSFQAPLSETTIGGQAALPLLVSEESGAGLEPLDNQSTTINSHTKSVQLSGETAHFSDLGVIDVASYDFAPQAVYTTVGSSWEGTVTVTNLLPKGLQPQVTTKAGVRTGDAGITLGPFGAFGNPSSVIGYTESLGQTVAAVHTGESLQFQLASYSCLNPGGGDFGVNFFLFTAVIVAHEGVTTGQLQAPGPGGLLPYHTGEPNPDVGGAYQDTKLGFFTVSSPADCGPKPTTTSSTSSSTTTTVVTPAPTKYPSAITAYFDQGAFSTFYTEPVYDPSWSYAWSVSIPIDPDCANGFHGSTPTPDKATWYHANTTEGGPCNHSGQDYNDVIGHPGTVTLVVTPPDKSWHCELLFYGTAPNNQDPRSPAVGNNPQCQRP